MAVAVALGAARVGRAQDLPSAAESLGAYQTLDGWVREWAVPSEPQSVDPPGTRGAMVTLRLAGRIVGRGAHMSEDSQSLWRAARAAWLEADRDMPFERDALREQNIADAAQRICIEAQFAGVLTPLLGETYEVASATVSPGFHGVAARVGDRVEALFPGAALAAGASAPEALRAAVGKLSLAPLELGQLVSRNQLVVYRFEARALAQPEPGAQPIFTYRGGRIIHLPEVNAARLRSAAEAIADRLMATTWPGQEPHGLLGDYHPLTDTYDPLIAPPLPQAVTAIAFAHYARIPGVAPERSRRAIEFARGIVEMLTQVTPDEADPLLDPLDAAMWLIARAAVEEAARGYAETEEGKALDFPEFRGAAQARVRSTFDAARDAWANDAPRAGRSLLACALAFDARDAEAPEGERGLAQAAVRSVLRDTARANLVGELPWIGWAEFALAPEPEPIPAADALTTVRATTWEFQVSDRDAGADYADMIGGILFTRSRQPLPTWQTLRPIAFFATALGEPRLTDAEQLRAEALALRRSLRFVLQLMIDGDNAWMYRDASRARGAVRSALWDHTCTLEASSLALIAIADTLHSSERRASQPSP